MGMKTRVCSRLRIKIGGCVYFIDTFKYADVLTKYEAPSEHSATRSYTWRDGSINISVFRFVGVEKFFGYSPRRNPMFRLKSINYLFGNQEEK